MKSHLILLSAVTALCAPASASAKEASYVFVSAQAVKDAPVVKLDRTKAYVLIRTPFAMAMNFTKLPTARDEAEYEKQKEDAFIKALKKHAKAVSRYKTDMELFKRTKGPKAPTAPIEPTRETFDFTSFETLANFTTGMRKRFSNEKGNDAYLHEVTPGTYRIYGQVDPLLAFGVCYCMGSVTFEVEAGKIIDLGTLGPDPDNSELREKGDGSSPQFGARAMALTPASDATAVDARIASFPLIKANFRAAGKTANRLGISISRIPKIRGVIDYDRDRIIDLRAVR